MQGIAHRQEILQRRVLELDADAGAISSRAGRRETGSGRCPG
jgi:hypothetical protein